MLKTLKYFLVGFALMLFADANATHIVGGELYYTFLGSDNYRITLKLYRDCLNGQPNFGGLGEGEAILNVAGYEGEFVSQFILGVPVVSKVPASTNNPCMQWPAGVCVEEGVYTKTVTLPPRAGGYFLTYETCCRNGSILNLRSPSSQGSKYTSYIPGPEIGPFNSSPRFVSYPSLYVCQGQPIVFDHKAFDPDGDSLAYSLIPAYNGLSNDSLVEYVTPYSGSYPMNANPALTINSSSGNLSGTPTMQGQFVVCVQVREYRNGKLLCRHYRDFQYNVINCNLIVDAGFADQKTKCMGSTITFTNQSYSNFGMSYMWNFGVPSIGTDSSSSFSPSYTFPDTGSYVVTLVVNPGLPCADSVKKTIYVYPQFAPLFNIPSNPQCFKTNTITYNITGTMQPSATFTSYFGTGTSPSISNSLITDVIYEASGVYPIKIYGKQSICVDSLIDSMRILARPIPQVDNLPATICDPGTITFSNISISEYACDYVWEISDGATYFDSIPTHVFSPAGTHSVTLTIFRNGACPDTIVSPVYEVTVFPSPKADFVATPSVASVFEPEIEFESKATGGIVYFTYDFGDGTISNYINDKHHYKYPGVYKVSQTVINDYDCKDVIFKDIVITPEFRFWVPNAFTPTGDDLNEEFKPFAIGITDYKMDIFSRDGLKLFTTYSLDKGWNGTYKGEPCKQDVYVWKASYVSEVTNKPATKTGYVILFRVD